MESEYAKHEKDYIKKYQEKGYTANFRFEDGKLIASQSKTSYGPGDIFIVADHRYEGMSNPSDMSILYVIETSDGKKGTLLLGYGPNADLDATEFFKAVPKENVSDKASIDQ